MARTVTIPSTSSTSSTEQEPLTSRMGVAEHAQGKPCARDSPAPLQDILANPTNLTRRMSMCTQPAVCAAEQAR